MKRPFIIVGLAVIALLAILVIRTAPPPLASRPVRLVITGPEGQRFSGSYVADGVTNSVSAIAPATITVHTRNLAYEFKREGGEAEFRVALFVGDLPRLSTTSDKRQGVRGELRYTAARESYWAAGF